MGDGFGSTHIPDIVVVGSINADLVLRVETLPAEGETLTATSLEMHNGGKGANQAVALARLGHRPKMIGSVGSDLRGAELVNALVAEAVDITFIRQLPTATGLAVVLVDESGNNAIVVHPGANHKLSIDDLENASGVLAGADAVLVQMEIPTKTVAAALQHASGLTVLNPAPAQPLEPEVLAFVDVLVPNETELGVLADVPTPTTDQHVIDAVRSLDFDGTTIVTMGSLGSLAFQPTGAVLRAIPPSVTVRDTVGAGDAFCAGLTDAFARGNSLDETLIWATACGAHATTIPGAQPSMPHREDAIGLVPDVRLSRIT